MKRLFLLLSISLFSFSAAIAQDMQSATNIYNEGAMALQSDDKASALQKFEEALSQATTIGPEAEELATNCKNAIPVVIMSIGKEQAAAGDIDAAMATFKKAIEKANEYDNQEVVDEATSLMPQLYVAEGNNKLNEKDFPGAVAMYKKAVELNPTDGVAYLRMGMASSRTEDEATTVDAFQKAAANGQEADAKKELAKYYYRMSATAYKGKKNDSALSYAKKSIETFDCPESVQSMKIGGNAAFTLKKYSEAITNFEGYLAKSPNAKDANAIMYKIASSYEAVGNKAKACGYYKQIISDPNFKEYATYKVNTELKCN